MEIKVFKVKKEGRELKETPALKATQDLKAVLVTEETKAQKVIQDLKELLVLKGTLEKMYLLYTMQGWLMII